MADPVTPDGSNAEVFTSLRARYEALVAIPVQGFIEIETYLRALQTLIVEAKDHGFLWPEIASTQKGVAL